MSQPLRIEYAGAFNHVMNRGLNRNAIFLSERDDRLLLKKNAGENGLPIENPRSCVFFNANSHPSID